MDFLLPASSITLWKRCTVENHQVWLKVVEQDTLTVLRSIPTMRLRRRRLAGHPKPVDLSRTCRTDDGRASTTVAAPFFVMRCCRPGRSLRLNSS